MSRRALHDAVRLSLALLLAGAVGVAVDVWGAAPAAASEAVRPATQSAAKPVPKPKRRSTNAARLAARTPYGSLDVASGGLGTVRVAGWAKDPDTMWPIDVVVSVDGTPVTKLVAAAIRPDLGWESAHGFDRVVPVAGSGARTVCVHAVNVGVGLPLGALGCRWVNVVDANPQGSIDSVAVDFSGVRVRGSARDPEVEWPVAIDVIVDFAAMPRLVANLGAGREFDVTYPLAPGNHFVCLTAVNIGYGSDTLLGCRVFAVRSATPVGGLESVALVGAEIEVGGWTFDPDGLGPTEVNVAAYPLGGVTDGPSTRAVASVRRPEVEAFVGASSPVGFRAAVRAPAGGQYFVCVRAVNRGIGADAVLGCQVIDVVDRRAVGDVDLVRPSAGSVQVAGWATDVDTSAPVSVRIAIDGLTRTTSASLASLSAGGGTAAVASDAPPGKVFDVTIPGLAPGVHSVCVTLLDVGATGPGITGDRALPCGSVVVGAIAVGTSGAAAAVTTVGPGPGHMLANVDRDAGVSATLSDGSVLWLFGDSAEVDAAGNLRYFVSGTAAWAPAASPTVTRDAVDAAGRPYVLVADEPPTPCPAGLAPGMWPLSAVTVPVDGRDRVIVHLADMCIGPSSAQYRGLAVADWWYDPTGPPPGPVQLQLVRRSVASTNRYGSAALYDAASGNVLLYACPVPANLWFFDLYGPCTVARTAPASVGDLATYRYWNGSTWVTNPAAAAPMAMPSGASGSTRSPVSAFTVTFDAVHGVYVMVYSPWPGFNDVAMVRVARTPVGPWTPPVQLQLPGCSDTVRGAAAACYAATAQPAMSRPGELGIGFYDQAALTGPTRGAYVAARVPFKVG